MILILNKWLLSELYLLNMFLQWILDGRCTFAGPYQRLHFQNNLGDTVFHHCQPGHNFFPSILFCRYKFQTHRTHVPNMLGLCNQLKWNLYSELRFILILKIDNPHVKVLRVNNSRLHLTKIATPDWNLNNRLEKICYSLPFSQNCPVYPGEHWHSPLTQFPWLLQSGTSHSLWCIEHSAPFQPG